MKVIVVGGDPRECGCNWIFTPPGMWSIDGEHTCPEDSPARPGNWRQRGDK